MLSIRYGEDFGKAVWAVVRRIWAGTGQAKCVCGRTYSACYGVFGV